ncbi:MFS transporter [Streptomyces sp. Amel2xC10]|uniref:MFS transporter n=1 Tax=Streptomyces sp. Amel2xC10 TaxID=1305826 RepID=UPI000A08EA90|nr:MFS transporter [Streptomyces sp. Amel2xC10]SMF04110.1 Predicted arabinose efflux permease, MFS family [Streptomyces sp. Amel2xC10]
MSSPTPARVSPDISPPPGGRWTAVLALAGATFSVVTTEMLPVGLLTPLGDGLGVSAGTAGLALTLPGLVAAVAAPLLPAAVRRADRRRVLVGLSLLLAAADLLSALAPGMAALLVARALVGVCIGGVWTVAAGLAVRLVPAASVGRATAVVFSGIAVASVLGVPAGTVLGATAGWRWAFAGLAVLAVAVAAALALALPPLPAEHTVGTGELRRVAALPGVRRGLAVVGLLVTGHFAAYTYVRPVLERVPGLGAGSGAGAAGTLLLGYGVAGVVGTLAAGPAAARGPRRTVCVVAAGVTAVVALLVPAGGSLGASALLLVLWGFVYGGVAVSAQTWLTAAAPRAPEAVSALIAAVFNTAIALGAFTGGRTADTAGATGVLWLGAGLALLSVLAALPRPAARRARRTRRPESAGGPGRTAGGWGT